MLSTKMQNYNLCLTPDNLYTYDCKAWNQRGYFYKYIKIDDVTYNENWITKVVSDAFKVTSKVIWYKKGYKEFEITSIFTDFKRF
jgi:predicted CoA-binding protein